MFGLSENDYLFIVKQLTKFTNEGAKIWCFGSRARGDYHEFSDLDIMIEDKQARGQEIGHLHEIFEESRLPIKVDLVKERNFAESYFESYLKDRKIFLDRI